MVMEVQERTGRDGWSEMGFWNGMASIIWYEHERACDEH